MKREIVYTSDGSSSIYLPEMDEHYHSKHGAIAESEHIFIQNGLLSKKELKEIHVFEVGMGTGLNVLTSLRAAEQYSLNVNYTAVETFPVSGEELQEINYSTLLGINDDWFKQVHELDWNSTHKLETNFTLRKHKLKLQNMTFEPEQFDVVYFDAFAPEKQNEMWTEKVFSDLYHALRKSGVLVTYCVKGEIRRRLQKVGFHVEKLKGPEGGKREMCRATKPE